MALPLVCIYLRGSVSRGLALPTSDIDFLAIYRNAEGLATDWSWRSGLKISEREEFQPEVDIDFLDVDLLFRAEGGRVYQFLLSTQSQLVWGESLQVPKFPLDTSILFQAKRLAKDVGSFLRTPMGPLKGEQVLRRALRACGELAALKTKAFSRDLGLCCENFERAYPGRVGSALREGLHLALGNANDPAVVAVCLSAILDEVQAILTELGVTPRLGSP